MSGVQLGQYFLYDTNRQIDPSLVGTDEKIYICNMDAASAMTVGTRAPGNMNLLVAGASITTAADVMSLTKACALGGSAYMIDQSFPRIGSSDYSLSVEVYDADWSSVSDASLISQMDVAGENGMKLCLANGDGKIHLYHYSAAGATLDVSYDVTSLTAGYHTIGVNVNRGVAQDILIDGVVVASDTDAADGIGTPTPVTKSVSAITKAAVAKITTSTTHGRSTGDIVTITGVVGEGNSYDRHGMDTLNGRSFKITVVDTTNFSLDGVDSTSWDAYASGGTITYNPPMYLEIGSDGGGQHKFTGRLDEIIIQLDGYWASDVHKLLYGIPRNSMLILDANSAVKTVTVS